MCMFSRLWRDATRCWYDEHPAAGLLHRPPTAPRTAPSTQKGRKKNTAQTLPQPFPPSHRKKTSPPFITPSTSIILSIIANFILYLFLSFSEIYLVKIYTEEKKYEGESYVFSTSALILGNTKHLVFASIIGCDTAEQNCHLFFFQPACRNVAHCGKTVPMINKIK